MSNRVSALTNIGTSGLLGAALLALASCGGGGGTSGKPPEMEITPPSKAPDLRVGTPAVSDSSPDAGASFTLRVTVRNGGGGRSATTILRYYRSSDATISTSDTAVGIDPVGALAASGTSAQSISQTAPSSAGTYYYGACVGTVFGETSTTNNCSSGVRVTVTAPSGGDDHSNTRSGATSLSLGSSRSGQIETGNDVDYFKVQVSNSGTLTVYTTGDLDTEGQLENSLGSLLAMNSDGGSGFNFRIVHAVSPGTYYIKVEGWNSGTGSYTIHASRASGGGRFGAVAVVLPRGCRVAAGLVVNQSSAPAALDAARRACQSEGGSAADCRTKSDSFRGCAAIVYGENFPRCVVGYALGSTRSAAESAALSGCRAGGFNCRILTNQSGQRLSACNSSSNSNASMGESGVLMESMELLEFRQLIP